MAAGLGLAFAGWRRVENAPVGEPESVDYGGFALVIGGEPPPHWLGRASAVSTVAGTSA